MLDNKRLDRELAREIADAYADPTFVEVCEDAIFEALQGRRIMGANDAKIVDQKHMQEMRQNMLRDRYEADGLSTLQRIPPPSRTD